MGFMYRFIRHMSTKARTKVIKKKTNAQLALEHFDGIYGNVYGKAWPSIRLGLLSPKKHVCILNTFVNHEQMEDRLVNEFKAVSLQRYYKKHLSAYIRWQLREKIIENKKARKRELMAQDLDVPVEIIDPNSVEVSDVSDSELKGAQTTDAEGFSSAEDLQEMFSDRRMDDDERYFINRASTQISLDDFVPASEMILKDEQIDHLAYYEGFREDIDTNITILEEPHLDLCNELKVFTFPRNSWDKFEPATADPTSKLLSHYMLDGASLLPIYALDLRMGDTCADYCAAPGGKSLAMLMTLRPSKLVSNDYSSSRVARLQRVFKQYLPKINYISTSLEVINHDAKSMIYKDTFDKILVDVPCSNDRHSAETLENNIFKRGRTEERLKLPFFQCEILKAALKSLKPDGSVVYSTCTLSPVENDGVVQRALIQLLEEGSPCKFAVMNLKESFRPFRGLFKIKSNFLYGQQVIPNICSNFGPIYISKIKRIQ